MSDVPYPKAMEAFPGIRQSLLARFDSCGLATHFDLAYREGWSGHPQGRGTLFHRFAAKALAEMASRGEETIEVDVALAILMEVLRQADVPDEEVVTVPMSHVDDLYWVVKKWAYDNVWSIDALVDIEKRLEATLHYPKPQGGFVERSFTGQLDALFVGGNMDEAIVIDWKDTWAMPPPSSVSDAGFFQQRAYAFLVMKNYPAIQRVTLREFYVRYSEPREATIWRSTLDDIEQELAALAERFDRAYENESWQPSPGAHCGWCPRPTACPIFPAARGDGRISTPEIAERVAARLIVAKAAVKQDQAALKAWASEHGSVPVRDAKGHRVYGHRPTKRVERPTKEEMEQAVATAGPEGVNVDDLYVEKTSTRFEAFRPSTETVPDDDRKRLREAVRSQDEDG